MRRNERHINCYATYELLCGASHKSSTTTYLKMSISSISARTSSLVWWNSFLGPSTTDLSLNGPGYKKAPIVIASIVAEKSPVGALF